MLKEVINLKLLRLSIVVVLFSIVLLPQNCFAEVWKITSLDWQPYSGSDMATQGKSIQLLKGILQKEGITLEVEFFPWLRSQELAKTEKYIGYFPAWPEEVAGGFVASLPVDMSDIGILKLKNAVINMKTLEDLFKNHKVGYVQTYVYPKEINDLIKKYPTKSDPTPDEASLVKKLSLKRIDVAITDPNVMLYMASKEGISDVELLKNISKKELVIALRNDKENAQRIKRLSEILSKYKIK